MDNIFDFSPEAIRERTIKELKRMFGSRIKQNFLIQMLDKVEERIFFDIPKYFSIAMDDKSMVSGSTDAVEFEICKNIVGIHRSNLIFLSNEERSSLENDQKYRDQLIGNVINQIKLRKYAGAYFRKFPVVTGDEFIYYPLPYYEFAISCYAEILLSKYLKCKCFGLYSAIFNKSLAALSLLEDNLLDNAYPICRGGIELFLKLIYFHDNNNLLSEYEKFIEFEVDKECCGNKRKNEFKKLFNNRKNKTKPSLNNYLHYGWVDKIDNYHKIVKNNPYTFNGFIEYLIETTKIEALDSLKHFYKMSSAFTHGNVGMTRYPLLHYFEISIILGIIISSSFDLLIKDTLADSTIENIEILKKMMEELDKTTNQYNKRSTKNFESYYNHHFADKADYN